MSIISFVISTLTGCYNPNTVTTLTLNDVTFEKSTGTITEYKSNYTNIAIPNRLDGTLVTTIGDYAFLENA